ncbi:MAG TPA: penicillin-binding protein 2 [Pseudonocardiaceae bacterium]|nr:penicillin-binding protein 2 [Pseudonocardiaceae bacterium]
MVRPPAGGGPARRPSPQVRRTASAGRAAPARRPAPPPPPRPRPKRRWSVVGSNSKPRLMIGRLLMIIALIGTGLKLIDIQGLQAPELASKAEQQSLTPMIIPAQRGIITDRDGTELAFNVDIRALTAQPRTMRKNWNDPSVAAEHAGITYAQHTQTIADEMHRLIGNSLNEQQVLTELRSNASFVYLDRTADPAVAAQITSDFPEIGSEVRSEREYPDGSVAANVIGLANWRTDPGVTPGVHGVLGLESAMDKQLAGQPGREVANTEQGNDSVVIPNSQRVLQAAVPGEDVQLTIDSDLQYVVQQKLAQYVAKTGAKRGSAVVLDAHTGAVYALANDATFNPNNTSTITNTNVGDPAVTTPYEPGSVNKVVTAAAAIDEGLVTPTSVINVPTVFQNGDKTVRDDWIHPDWKMTVTGIFAKSSNIGTDELAKMVGPQRYDQMLAKMGIGQQTGIELPGESAGYVPPMNKWSGSTFGNLPIGQGLSMTVLQMAGMYQAIANNGVRLPPRIIKAVTKPDGTVVPTKQPAGVRVVSAKSAVTVRMMMRAVTQKAPFPQDATAPSAALPGYQISGKTGTGQQIDPSCGCYSHTKNTVTFAGILSADNPRFVVGVMLDAPNGDLEGGETAAPLFHDIASWLAQRYNLPVSNGSTPYMTLVAQA